MTTQVFISYAKEDKRSAERLYRDLLQEGVKPWIDSADLVVGQHWEIAIRKAIRASDYFIALVSNQSVKKMGFVQKEIRHAIEIAQELPEDEIFILVLRLDNCEMPFEYLRTLHWADLFPSYEDGITDLLRAVQYKSVEKPALVSVVEGKRDGIVVRKNDKGFGFIQCRPVSDRRDLFFHTNELQNISFDELLEGDVVIFSIEEGPKGPVAVGVEKV